MASSKYKLNPAADREIEVARGIPPLPARGADLRRGIERREDGNGIRRKVSGSQPAGWRSILLAETAGLRFDSLAQEKQLRHLSVTKIHGASGLNGHTTCEKRAKFFEII
ncbi:unnamed protein product [Chondrus crispus]|uniref:Uncharacterized protein n=1 Tax=Chondrus crispus TaxID=2769 RepID=R7Q5E4_CHOCR|nr:unnamed protein product [Chondrus crispus]CDF33767.1 unnamed protein product [Chondrus crispus]|eukprot:XP_005713586.1 unnamed protein product [Chondrus crispus]